MPWAVRLLAYADGPVLGPFVDYSLGRPGYDMESDREVLLEIRDLLSRHVQTYSDWISHLKTSEGGLTEVLERAAQLERANQVLHRRVLFLGGLVIAGILVMVALKLGWRPG